MPEARDSTPDATTNETSLVGRQIGKYEILRVIARGGMGTVYEAQNKNIGKRVAMKFVDAVDDGATPGQAGLRPKPQLSRSKDAVLRFQREAEAASAVESEHIVTIFDSGTSDEGLPYIVMELLRGEDLGHRIKDVGRLELEAALDIVAQLLRGLCRAHDAGIVHRDLKPDNVFIVTRDDDSAHVKILDFGISKVRRTGGTPEKTITRQGTVLGTPFYMSPEQAQALPDVDERTDLWSVGAILYECLTGRPPYEGHAYEQVIVNICTKDAPDARFSNPAVPEPVARFIAKALTRDKDKRFENARQMLAALGEASEGLLPARATKVAASGSPARATLTSSPGTPRSADSPSAVEVGPSGPSRVGWSTTGGATTSKPRARFAVVAAAIVAAAIATIVIVATRTPDPEITPSPTAHAAEPPKPTESPEVPAGEPSSATQAPPAAPATSAAAKPEAEPGIVAPQTKKPKAATSATPPPPASAKPSPPPKEPGIAPQLKLKPE